MKKILALLLVLLMSSVFVIQKADAKWWIFGQGNDEVNINYLYLNNSSFDETGEKVTVYKNTLQNGLLNLNGKATVSRGKIGAVYISKDNKETWEKAKLSTNGTFQYNFKPEVAKEYEVLIKILDTTGKTNNIDNTYRKVTVVDENISAAITQALDEISKAYSNEELNLFMTHISPDFAGDYAVLDSAVRRDFNAFDYIQLRYFINNISTDSLGRTFVSINYIRTVVSTRSGITFSDNGYTELVFKNKNGKPKLFSMKNPLMFGLSDAGNVATGTIQSTNNNPILLVDESGNVDAKPFRTAIDIIENGSDSGNGGNPSIPSVTITLNNGNNYVAGHNFILDPMSWGEVFTPSGAYVKGSTDSINTMSTAIVTTSDNEIMLWNSSNTYSILLNDGKYMLARYYPYMGTVRMEYKYQPNGTNSF